MTTRPDEPWWRQILSEILRSAWTRALVIVFIVFEIYNAAILPAIRGTQDALISQNRIGQSKAEECLAKIKALQATVPIDKDGTARLERLIADCRAFVSNSP